MMDTAKELGVQSYCFRNFKDNAETAALVKQCGLSQIELCGVQVDFQAPETFEEVVGIYRDAGIRIVSTGVNAITAEAQKNRNLFEFLKVAGCGFMSVDFPIHTIPETFRAAEVLADEYDVKLAIHNHGGRHWLGSAAVLDWVFKQTSPRIGLNLDTAWALHSHEDPLAMIDRFADRLYGIHIKDFVFDRAGNHEDVVVGTGNLDLPGLLNKLEAIDFGGFVVLEYEGDADNPVPALTECVKAVAAAG